MSLSATQPAASALDGFFALAVSANPGTSGSLQATQFESLLGDALFPAIPVFGSTSIEKVSGNAVSAPLKSSGERKKQDSKNDTTQNAGAAPNPCPLVAVPLPTGPLGLVAPPANNNEKQFQQVLQVATRATKPAAVWSPNSESSAKEISDKQNEISRDAASVRGRLFSETSSNKGTPTLHSIVPNQSAPRLFASFASPEAPKITADSQLARNAPDLAAFTLSQSPQDWAVPDLSQPTAKQASAASVQYGLDLASGALLSDTAGANSLAELMSSAVVHLSPDITSADRHSTKAVAIQPPKSPVAEISGAEKVASAITQTHGLESLKTQPVSVHYQHAITGSSQTASSVLGRRNPTDLPKFADVDVSASTPEPRHTVINELKANSGLSPKADIPGPSANTASLSGTAAHNDDERKPSQIPDERPGPQNLRPTNIIPAPVQATVAQSANPSPTSTGMPVAAAQTNSPLVAPPPVTTTSPKIPIHDVQAPTPAAPASVQVHAACIVQTDNRAEMRLDMRTQAFGGVEIHTSISGKDVQLSVSAEHGDLHSFLSPEVPVLQSNLQQHDLRLGHVRTAISTGTQCDFSSDSDRHQQSFSRPQPQPGAFDQPRELAVDLDEEHSPKGLSIRI